MPAVPTLAFDYLPALPEIVLLISACAVLLIDLFVPEPRRHVSYWLTQLSLAATALATLYVFHKMPVRTFGNMFVADAFGDLLNFLSCVTVMLMLAYSRDYLAARGLFRGETFVLAMFALLGIDKDAAVALTFAHYALWLLASLPGAYLLFRSGVKVRDLEGATEG